jgi:segregation and condensation protein A
LKIARPPSPYSIDLPVFAGPLDLLLHLIDRQELDITAVSLAHVTAQYLAQIELLKQDRMEELIDFLVIGARLALIKSRALLPQEPVIGEDGKEEEDPAEALVRQLLRYRQFKQAAKFLQQREQDGLRTYLRVAPPPKLESKLDLSGVSVEVLMSAVRAALERTTSLEESVSVARPRTMTIQGQIERLRYRVRSGTAVPFETLMSDGAGRSEIAVTLLAVLELIKRREILAAQETMFGPIVIYAAPPSSSAGDSGDDDAYEFDDSDDLD